MTLPPGRHVASALLAMAALSAACGTATRSGSPPGEATGAPPKSTGNVLVGTDSARPTSVNAADAHFVAGMIAHHSQALAMSALAPQRAASPSVRILAERIAAGQQDEIGLMQSWLRDRGQAVPQVGPGPAAMTMNGMKHDMHMPGMLTEAQMRQLETARGPEFDRLFLTFMIQHHRGAVAMVRELFATSGAAQEQSVFKLASDVSADQSSEIERMQRMLAALAASGGTP